MIEISSLYAAIAALTTAVGFLYKVTKRTADECERDRRALWSHIAKMTNGAPPPPPNDNVPGAAN